MTNKCLITNDQMPKIRHWIFKNSSFIRHSDLGISNFLVICFLLLLLNGCQQKPLYKDTRMMMGTFVEVSSPDERAAAIAFDEIKRIEDLLSKYKPESEISRLNREGKQRGLSPETFQIIKKAKEYWQVSDGAFDITVASLMDLWGFTDKRFRVPSEEEIKEALAAVGSDKIVLQDSENVIEFNVPGVKVDLGAIAKGFAVDSAIKKLKAEGIISCLINAGGDIFCLGDKNGKPWNIAIQNPAGPGFRGSLELKDKAVATSGNYQQYFIKENKRFSHIINPKTGYPANSGVSSVSVIAADCTTADFLATAIFVLGKDKAQTLAEKFTDVEVILE